MLEDSIIFDMEELLDALRAWGFGRDKMKLRMKQAHRSLQWIKEAKEYIEKAKKDESEIKSKINEVKSSLAEKRDGLEADEIKECEEAIEGLLDGYEATRKWRHAEEEALEASRVALRCQLASIVFSKAKKQRKRKEKKQ